MWFLYPYNTVYFQLKIKEQKSNADGGFGHWDRGAMARSCCQSNPRLINSKNSIIIGSKRTIPGSKNVNQSRLELKKIPELRFSTRDTKFLQCFPSSPDRKIQSATVMLARPFKRAASNGCFLLVIKTKLPPYRGKLQTSRWNDGTIYRK